MKTILLITDFTKSTEKAYDKAVEIACKYSANILLFNSFVEHECDPTAATVVWRENEFYSQQVRSETLLKQQVSQLQKKLVLKSYRQAIPTDVLSISAYGQLAETVENVVLTRDIWAIIMGGKGMTNQGGRKAMQIRQKVSCPVFVIPQDPVYPPLNIVKSESSLPLQSIKKNHYD